MANKNGKKVLGKIFQPLRWTLELAGREYDIDSRTLAQRIAAAGVIPGNDGRFSTKQVVSVIFGDISGQKLRNLTALADLNELKVAVEKCDLVKVNHVEKLWSDCVLAMRQVILGSKLSEEEREELFLQLRDIGAAEYRKQRKEDKDESEV